MAALGHKRTLKRTPPMSVLPPKADMAQRRQDVRFVPKADLPVFRKTVEKLAEPVAAR